MSGTRPAAKSPTKPAPATPRPAHRTRADKSAARRAAILQAALDEFAARGFAAARLDDVARRAGVAKGTIYLHFRDKQELFEELVRTMLGPHIAALETLSTAEGSPRALGEFVFNHFVRDVLGSRVADVVRLVIQEGPRFPEIADFYYREIVQRALIDMSRLLKRAEESGELVHGQLLQFPHLVVAPFLMGIVWRSLFERFMPLDVAGLMRAHFDILFPPPRDSR